MSDEARLAYEFGPFRLDLPEHRLLRDGVPVPLTPKVFDVLRVLVEHSGHLVEKDTLLKEIWPDSFVEEGALNRYVSVLRKALGEGPSGQQYIETAPKRGYRFVAPVTECVDEASTSIVGPHNRPVVDIEANHTASPSIPHTAAPPQARTGMAVRAAVIAAALLTVGALAYGVLGPSAAEKSAPTPRAPAHRQVTFTGKEGGPTLSPDGRRIAYVSVDTPERKLMVQELAGGPPLAVFSAPEVGHLRWSPDGSELIVWARGAGRDGLYILPQLGGTLRRIRGGQFIACWSPDGSTIAVASYLIGKIWFVNKGGEEQRTVSLQGVHWSIGDIDWSGANGLLTFVSNDYQGRYTIWTIRPDGTDQKLVLAENTEIPSVRWAPHGDAIYYARRLNQTESLYKIRVRPDRDRGKETATPVITGLESDRSFALSADGRRLVYARAPYHSNLWMLETSGHGKHQRTGTKELTRGTSLIERPRVSPDGTSILFNMGHEPLANLYTMPLSGGSPKQLTFLDSFNVAGVWSPDGTRIAFASTQDGTPRVWTVDAGGGTPRAHSSGDLSDSFDLVWSPGSRILFQQTGNRNYYALDPETRHEHTLGRDSSVGWMFSPVYSPDGRKVAVAWNRRPNRGLWVLDPQHGQETLVHKTSALSMMPIGWSADGGSIYAVEATPLAYRGMTLPVGETVTDAKIVKVPVGGGHVKTVASLPFGEIGTVSMAPDERRFVVTVYSSRSDVWVVDHFDSAPEPTTTRQ